MTQETAQLIWDAKYKQKMTWDEIESRIGYTKQTITRIWNQYGIKPKFRRIGHAQPTKLTDEEIVRKLSIDTTQHTE